MVQLILQVKIDVHFTFWGEGIMNTLKLLHKSLGIYEPQIAKLLLQLMRTPEKNGVERIDSTLDSE